VTRFMGLKEQRSGFNGGKKGSLFYTKYLVALTSIVRHLYLVAYIPLAGKNVIRPHTTIVVPTRDAK
jgi:hypothetical protein